MIATAPLDPDRTALLLIASPQEDPPGPPAAGLAGAAALVRRARAVGVHVVHVHHLPPAGNEGGGTSAAVPAGWEAVVETRAADPFAGTRLQEELSARGVDAVVMAGPMTLDCCEAAALQSMARRYRTLVADDALGADERGAAERARVLRERNRAGAEVLSAGAIAGLWDAEDAPPL
ncbi:MAG: isochorismatase family protein [Thermoleophilia bacterium]